MEIFLLLKHVCMSLSHARVRAVPSLPILTSFSSPQFILHKLLFFHTFLLFFLRILLLFLLLIDFLLPGLVSRLLWSDCPFSEEFASEVLLTRVNNTYITYITIRCYITLHIKLHKLIMYYINIYELH